MSKYRDLDHRIRAALRKKPCTFGDLQSDGVMAAMAESVAPPARVGTGQGWRVIDRRLQVLRKNGLIEHRGGYWRASDLVRVAQPAPTRGPNGE